MSNHAKFLPIVLVMLAVLLLPAIAVTQPGPDESALDALARDVDRVVELERARRYLTLGLARELETTSAVAERSLVASAGLDRRVLVWSLDDGSEVTSWEADTDVHELLLANALAQAQALMQGREDAGGHRNFTGNRPSTFFLLDALTPGSLGALLALYEHRVFTSGALWGINSFDQWGVELGKVLATDLAQRIASGDAQGLDASTAGLLARVRRGR